MKPYLEPEDVQLMERNATCLRDKLLIQLLFRLGCRVSELLAIKVSDINFTDGKVTVLHLKTRIQLLCPNCKARLEGDINSALAVELASRIFLGVLMNIDEYECSQLINALWTCCESILPQTG